MIPSTFLRHSISEDMRSGTPKRRQEPPFSTHTHSCTNAQTARHATPRHATPRHATPRHATPCPICASHVVTRASLSTWAHAQRRSAITSASHCRRPALLCRRSVRCGLTVLFCTGEGVPPERWAVFQRGPDDNDPVALASPNYMPYTNIWMTLDHSAQAAAIVGALAAELAMDQKLGICGLGGHT